LNRSGKFFAIRGTNDMAIRCRLIVDSAGDHSARAASICDGAWNMAVDEMLLEQAAATAMWQLRVYGWHVPTLSLGYFQRFEERVEHAASREAAVVRRASGGGAILHDHEITYSLALNVGRGMRDHRRLYALVHAALARRLNALGVPAELQGPGVGPAPRSPFLCFQRRTEGDILLKHAKIAGSAQRRSRDALLQHGSLLVATSPTAPELLGIESLSGLHLPREEWAMLVEEAIVDGLQLAPEPSELTGDELEAAERLVRERFGRPEWTMRR
jgi:lipoyl(octanoyl) transferase